jgi:hypothetical protein
MDDLCTELLHSVGGRFVRDQREKSRPVRNRAGDVISQFTLIPCPYRHSYSLIDMANPKLHSIDEYETFPTEKRRSGRRSSGSR